MREYSPKRRTALVLTGTGTSGAYHAGVLRALDESGVKIDVVVGSGVGTVAAAFAAAAGGPRLYGAGRVLGRRGLGLALPPARRAADRDPAARVLVRRLPAARRPRAPGRGPLPPARPRRPRHARPHRAHDRGHLGRARRAPGAVPGRALAAHLRPVRAGLPRPPAPGAARPAPHSRVASRPSSIPRWARRGWGRGCGRSRAAPPSPRSRPRRRRSAASTWPSSPRTWGSPASAS